MFYQVNKIVSRLHIGSRSFRYFSYYDSTSANTLYPLESKRLLRVGGPDASAFLQGLITNDMRHFEDGAKSMYAMLLNNKGRVMYDTLIHRFENDKSFILECDKNIIEQLQRHLKMFRLKRKVEIADVTQKYRLWVFISSHDAVPECADSKEELNIYKDPRLTDLGYRIITSLPVSRLDILEKIGNDVYIEENEEGYKYLRYQLGISEGAQDLPPGTCFPLEVNCDYLHGVSFHKGCYIGQELTARVHHTGVVRKRVMPLRFKENPGPLDFDTIISDKDKSKSNVGKLKGISKDFGIGLVRIREVMNAKGLIVGNNDAEIIKPHWWPKEAPKEKAPVINKLEE